MNNEWTNADRRFARSVQVDLGAFPSRLEIAEAELSVALIELDARRKHANVYADLLEEKDQQIATLRHHRAGLIVTGIVLAILVVHHGEQWLRSFGCETFPLAVERTEVQGG